MVPLMVTAEKHFGYILDQVIINLRVIAPYYLDCVSKLNNVIPMIVRSDRGSENVVLAGIQQYFRHNDSDQFAERNSFRYGTSSAKQIFKAWSSQLKVH